MYSSGKNCGEFGLPDQNPSEELDIAGICIAGEAVLAGGASEGKREVLGACWRGKGGVESQRVITYELLSAQAE